MRRATPEEYANAARAFRADIRIASRVFCGALGYIPTQDQILAVERAAIAKLPIIPIKPEGDKEDAPLEGAVAHE